MINEVSQDLVQNPLPEVLSKWPTKEEYQRLLHQYIEDHQRMTEELLRKKHFAEQRIPDMAVVMMNVEFAFTFFAIVTSLIEKIPCSFSWTDKTPPKTTACAVPKVYCNDTEVYLVEDWEKLVAQGETLKLKGVTIYFNISEMVYELGLRDRLIAFVKKNSKLTEDPEEVFEAQASYVMKTANHYTQIAIEELSHALFLYSVFQSSIRLKQWLKYDKDYTHNTKVIQNSRQFSDNIDTELEVYRKSRIESKAAVLVDLFTQKYLD